MAGLDMDEGCCQRLAMDDGHSWLRRLPSRGVLPTPYLPDLFRIGRVSPHARLRGSSAHTFVMLSDPLHFTVMDFLLHTAWVFFILLDFICIIITVSICISARLNWCCVTSRSTFIIF